jgi:hypothetical protein
MITKVCTSCKVEKPVEGFNKKRNGLQPICKICDAARAKAWRARNPERKAASDKAYCKKNKAQVAARHKIYIKQNKQHLAALQKVYREQNKANLAAAEKAWRNQNKERVAKNRSDYHKQNKERISAYRAQKKEHIAATHKTYRELNREKFRAKSSKRRATKLNATPSWSDTSEIVDFYEAAIAFRIYTGQEYHVDHIVPLQGKTVCGLHVPANLQVLPGSDNISKGNRSWPDMWEKL